MIVVTGGAGFIGSAIVGELNNRGEKDILVVDVLDHERKRRNLRPLKYRELSGIEDFRQRLSRNTNAGILNRNFQHGMRLCRMHLDPNSTAFGREFDRIG